MRAPVTQVVPLTTQALVEAAKAFVPRCLTLRQRTSLGLPPAPPAWCLALKKWPYLDGQNDVMAGK